MREREPDTVVVVYPLHLKRLTGWVAYCDEHDLIPSRRVKRSAVAEAQKHIRDLHATEDVAFNVRSRA